MQATLEFASSLRQSWRIAAQMWILGLKRKSHESFSVLDLGIERGLTGIAVRSHFPKARITGVEIHKPYIDDFAAANKILGIYSQIHEADANDFLCGCGRDWDVIVAAEIIEHMTKERGKELLEHLKRRAKFAIVTTPLGFMHQGALHGNPHQEHLSGWTREEMVEAGFTPFVTLDLSRCGIYYCERS